MAKHSVEHAILFTPGRASYLDENGVLQLSAASLRRADVALETYTNNPGYYDHAVFAGGYPRLAKGWDDAYQPPADRREAHLMAASLIQGLIRQGMSSKNIAEIVKIEGESSDSFGDVIESVDRGYLDPNEFNTDMTLGIDVVAGRLHGQGRFVPELAKDLDIDKNRINVIQMRDIYGTPAHGVPGEPTYQEAESTPKAIAKELMVIGATAFLLAGVKSGDREAMKAAHLQFETLATEGVMGLVKSMLKHAA